MTQFKEVQLPASSLLLDPNNFRFQDENGYVMVDAGRFHEQSVQERAFRRIRTEGVSELKASILTNGFLAVERLVVKPYDGADGLYVVVEGNRRLAALRWLQDDYETGVNVPTSVREALDAVPVIVIEGEGDDSIYLSLMGIRHVGGIRQWGGYQRAKLVTELRDKHALEAADVGSRLGMSTVEVNRRYRAFKALQQMQEDEEFGDRASSNMYNLFHEAVALPVIREWLTWKEGEGFTDLDERSKFYELITSTEGEDGEKKADPRITTYSQVRDLKAILAVPEAKRALLESDRTFSEALAIAKAEEMSRSWAAEAAEAALSLRKIGALELQSLDEAGIDQIIKLRDIASQVVETYNKLHS